MSSLYLSTFIKRTLDSSKNIDYDKQGSWHSTNNSNNKHSTVGSGSHTYNTGNIGSNNATHSNNTTNGNSTSRKREQARKQQQRLESQQQQQQQQQQQSSPRKYRFKQRTIRTRPMTSISKTSAIGEQIDWDWDVFGDRIVLPESLVFELEENDIAPSELIFELKCGKSGKKYFASAFDFESFDYYGYIPEWILKGIFPANWGGSTLRIKIADPLPKCTQVTLSYSYYSDYGTKYKVAQKEAEARRGLLRHHVVFKGLSIAVAPMFNGKPVELTVTAIECAAGHCDVARVVHNHLPKIVLKKLGGPSVDSIDPTIHPQGSHQRARAEKQKDRDDEEVKQEQHVQQQYKSEQKEEKKKESDNNGMENKEQIELDRNGSRLNSFEIGKQRINDRNVSPSLESPQRICTRSNYHSAEANDRGAGSSGDSGHHLSQLKQPIIAKQLQKASCRVNRQLFAKTVIKNKDDVKTGEVQQKEAAVENIYKSNGVEFVRFNGQIAYEFDFNSFMIDPMGTAPNDRNLRQLYPFYQNLGRQGQEVKLIEKGLKRDNINMDPALLVTTGKGNIVRVYDREIGLQGLMCTLHDHRDKNACLYRSGGFKNTYGLIERFERKHMICLNKELHKHKPDLIEALTVDPQHNKIDILQTVQQQIDEFLADIMTVNDKKKVEEERKEYDISGKKLDKWIVDLMNAKNSAALKMLFGDEYELVEDEMDGSFYEDIAVGVCMICHDTKGINGGCAHQVGVRDSDFDFVKYYEGFESIWCDKVQPKICYFGDKLGYCINIGFNKYMCMNNLENMDINVIERVKNEMRNHIREKEYGGRDPHEILGDVMNKWKHLKVNSNCYYAVLPNKFSHIIELYPNIEMVQQSMPHNIFCKICSKIDNVQEYDGMKQIEMGGKAKHNVCQKGYCSNVLKLDIGKANIDVIGTYEAFVNVVNQPVRHN